MLTITKRGTGFSVNGSGRELAKLLRSAEKSYTDRAANMEDEEVKAFYTETAEGYAELATKAETGKLD